MKGISLLLAILFFCVQLAPAQTTYTVTTSVDAGLGSLRQAILDANASAGPDIVEFNIPGAGPHKILLSSKLPDIISPLTIDGFSQAGAAVGDLWAGTPHTLMIEVDGSGETLPSVNSYGIFNFKTGSEGSLMKGMVITGSQSPGGNANSGYAISIWVSSAVIESCYIGTNTNGSAAPNPHDQTAIVVYQPAGSTGSVVIGGATGDKGNLISGNNVTVGNGSGAIFIDQAAPGSGGKVLVQNNFIGTDAGGTSALPNTTGVQVWNGTAVEVTHNLISGNEQYAVGTVSPPTPVTMKITGNYIGTDRSGLLAVSNGLTASDPAIYSWNNSGTVTLGGTSHTLNVCDGDCNLISGNAGVGYRSNSTTNTTIEGNYIGVDVTGTAGLGNGANAIDVQEAFNLQIGSAVDPEMGRNIISGNKSDQINIAGSTYQILDNYIGTNNLGNTIIYHPDQDNPAHGINVRETYTNATGLIENKIERNLINSFTGSGIFVNGQADVDGNERIVHISGNVVGLDVSGMNSLTVPFTPQYGIEGRDAVQLRITPDLNGNRNIISLNSSNGGGDGIHVWTNSGAIVSDNYVGTDINGENDKSNMQQGIVVSLGTSHQVTGNVVGGVEGNGITFENDATKSEALLNKIGMDVNGNALANGGNGVQVSSNATKISIRENQIAFNGGIGIDLGGDAVTTNDAGDSDSGPNDYLNFPIITGSSGDDITLKLDVPAGNYLISFYGNPSGLDPSQHGEGQVYVGSVNISHAGVGEQIFTETVTGAGAAVSMAATTTEVDATTSSGYGSTSEFSGPEPVIEPCVIDLSAAQIAETDPTSKSLIAPTAVGAANFFAIPSSIVENMSAGSWGAALPLPATFELDPATPPASGVEFGGISYSFTADPGIQVTNVQVEFSYDQYNDNDAVYIVLADASGNPVPHVVNAEVAGATLSENVILSLDGIGPIFSVSNADPSADLSGKYIVNFQLASPQNADNVQVTFLMDGWDGSGTPNAKYTIHSIQAATTTDAPSCTSAFNGTVTFTGLNLDAETQYDLYYDDASSVNHGPVVLKTDVNGDLALTGLRQGDYNNIRVAARGEDDCEDTFQDNVRLTLPCALPVHWISVTARKSEEKIRISWKVTEEDVAEYRVLRSWDGRFFEQIGGSVATRNGYSENSYEFIDQTVVLTNASEVYYRIQSVDLDGTKAVSRIVAVELGPVVTAAFPNPTTGKVLLKGLEKTVSIQVINGVGNLIATFLPHQSQMELNLRSYPNGVYLIKTIGTDGRVETKKVSLIR